MIFTLIIATAVIFPLAFLSKNTLKQILISQQKQKGLILFSAVFLLGASVGWWLGFTFKYEISNTIQVLGCPIPFLVFHLENGQWVDFVMPFPLLNAILNLIIVTLLSLAPLNFIFRIHNKKMDDTFKRIICVALGLLIVSSCITSPSSSSIPIGTWKMISCQRGGKRQPVKNIYLTFQEDRFEVKRDGAIIESGTVTFNTSVSPMQYDAVIADAQNKKRTYQAIYKIKGDIMIACVNSQATGHRPNDFAAIRTTYQLVKWKRTEYK